MSTNKSKIKDPENKTPQLCEICQNTHHSKIIYPVCEHFFGKKCLENFHAKFFSKNEFYWPKCPKANCDTHLPEENISEIIGEDMFKKHFFTCNSCKKIGFRKLSIKLNQCSHRLCIDCFPKAEKKNKCLSKKCSQELKDEDRKKYKKKTKKCLICKETLVKDFISNHCCASPCCKKCLKEQINQMKEGVKKIKCPFCQKKMKKPIIEEVIGEKKFEEIMEMNQKILCEKCDHYKSADFFKTLDCGHSVCCECFEEKNKNEKTIICPIKKCKKINKDLYNREKEEEKTFQKSHINQKEDKKVKKTRQLQKSQSIEKENEEKEKNIRDNSKLNEEKNLKLEPQRAEHNDNNNLKENEQNDLQILHKCSRCSKSIEEDNEKYFKYDQYIHEKCMTTITCTICYESKSEVEFISLTCGHSFCKKCLIRDWTEKIELGHIDASFLKCPNVGCNVEINFYTLKEHLNDTTFKKYDDFLTEKTLLNDNSHKEIKEKFISCPNPKCSRKFCIWNEADYFACDFCNKKYCAKENCKGDWNSHEKKSCQEYKNYMSKNKSNVKDEDDFLKKNFKKCPICGVFIEKIKNCNYVRCESLKCQKKTIFCYLCGEILTEKTIRSHYIGDNFYSKCKVNLDIMANPELIDSNKPKFDVGSNFSKEQEKNRGESYNHDIDENKFKENLQVETVMGNNESEFGNENNVSLKKTKPSEMKSSDQIKTREKMMEKNVNESEAKTNFTTEKKIWESQDILSLDESKIKFDQKQGCFVMNEIKIICPACTEKKLDNFQFLKFRYGCICKTCKEYVCLICRNPTAKDSIILENHIIAHYKYEG